jgi:ABC-type Fe3+-siderophore transport system permease subunit
MISKATESQNQENWKPRVLVIGAVLGALVGMGAAYLISQQAEKSGKKPEMSAGAGIRLGLLVLGLLRQVAALGDGN